MLTHVLMPDTQVILLLCASFGQSRQLEPQPLTLREYNYLAQWLQQHQMRPADLLTIAGKEQLLAMANSTLDAKRLAALLERGALLGFAVESWTNKGLWVLGRSDEHYPRRLKAQLRYLAPPILYGVGNQELLSQGGLAVVGSREVDEAGLKYTQRVAQSCAEQGIQIVSGGARGVDQAAMMAAVEAGGTTVGVLADSLTKAAVSGKYRAGIREKRLTLVSAYDPDARFHVGNAMGRNKYIYALADYALVVSSTFNQGGTWAGATEALERGKSVPVFVRSQGTVPEGNHQLIKIGAKPFPEEPWNGSLRALLNSTAQADAGVIDALSTEQVEINGEVMSSEVTNGLGAESQVDSAVVLEREPQLDRVTALPSNGNHAKPKDAFEAVLSLMLSYLKEPRSEKSLAALLGVRAVQMRDWLQRATEEGMVKKTNKGYVANYEDSQLSLLS